MPISNYPTKQQLLILETYPSNESAYDGLSGLFQEIAPIGRVIADTSSLEGQKVLVCGIAPLYEEKISPNNINIIFTTFESDRLPDHWIPAINQYQRCVVPHAAVRQVFIDSGVKPPISVIQNGYKRYERLKKEKMAATFDIGFLGIPVSRKNLIPLYKACKQLKQSAIPELQLHIHVAAFYSWLAPEPFEMIRTDPIVRWTTGRYTPADIATWYGELSCYIFPSSGEGWSCTPRESMYLGIPTIISDIPVHKEMTESGFYGIIPTAGPEPADFNGHIHGNWDRIDEQDIKNAILDLYLRYPHYQELASRGAAWIENIWTNEDIGQQLIELTGSF